MGSTLYLKITDLCSFVPRSDRITLLLPWARRPIDSPNTTLPSPQNVDPIEAHFPTLEFLPGDLAANNQANDYVVIRRTPGGPEIGLWFFNEHDLSIQTGKSGAVLMVSQDFRDHVVSFSDIYPSVQHRKVAPQCLQASPNSDRKRIDARLDILDGHLTVIKRTVEGTQLLPWEFRSVRGVAPANPVRKTGLAEECLLAIPDVQVVSVERRRFGSASSDALSFRAGADVGLHLRNSPMTDILGLFDQDVPPFERKRAKHFQVFSDQLLTQIDDADRLIPWFLDFSSTSGLIHCPQSQINE